MASLMVGRALAVALVMGMSGAVAAQEAPAPVGAVRGESLSATVESVDMATRQILLHLPEGRFVTAVAGPEVRNLGRVRPGDRVRIDYREAVAVAMARPGDRRPPVGLDTMAARARPGQRPGAALGQAIRVRVRIDAVGEDAQTVSFTGPRGAQRTVTVQDPELRDFARRLQPGDQVDIAYAEALVARVEPATP